LQVERPEEVRKVLESDDEPPNYSDLSTFTRKEWEDFKRSGARFESVGEELATRRVIAKERAKERRRQKQTLPEVNEQPESAPDEWNSEANDYESKTSADELEEDVSQGEDSQHRDADASERELFDGPFAVVVPSRKN
jgi:hypothetical protein